MLVLFILMATDLLLQGLGGLRKVAVLKEIMVDAWFLGDAVARSPTPAI